MCDASGATSWSHDKIGRTLKETRKIATLTNSTTYGYNLDGSLASLTYPTGRVLTYVPGGAGRSLSLTDSTGPINYVSSAHYAAFGGLTSISLGSKPISILNAYNDRLQPVLLSASASTTSIMSLCYDFHLHIAVSIAPCSFSASTAGDNGDVYQIVNNRDGNRTQNFIYDSLNRIQQGYTNGPNWGETFSPTATAPGTAPLTSGIDAWGNLTNRSGVTGKTNYELLSAPVSLQNRLTGFGYDAAGNMISNGSVTYTYDAENRLTSTAGCTYVYDGDGTRNEKTGCTSLAFWHDLSGNTLEEAGLSGSMVREFAFFNGQRTARRNVSSNTVYYFLSDHLGSTSLVTDAIGTMPPQMESDYYPFGGEIAITTGITDQSYKFTGKERDSESGLDNFGKRYDSSSLGRFMSADPFIPFNLKRDKFQDWISNPQHWNKYAYALNNPLLYVDPSGMTETIYYWLNSSLTDAQKKYFQEHKTEIFKAITDKLNKAGIKDVVFKDGTTLNKSQVNSILASQPKGVAFLNFANKSYAGVNAPSDMFGATGGMRSAVFVGNLQAGNPSTSDLSFRISEVSDHELGHGMDFYSRGETMSFIEFWNKDLMNEGQATPTKPRQFDMSIPQNRQAVDEINKLPEYNPPK